LLQKKSILMDDYRKLVEKDEKQIKGKSILEIEKTVN